MVGKFNKHGCKYVLCMLSSFPPDGYSWVLYLIHMTDLCLVLLVCVYMWVCVCTCVHMPTYMCTWSLPTWLDWLANELQGSACLCLSSTGITSACCYTHLPCGYRGPELSSSCFQDKHCPKWAISPDSLFPVFLSKHLTAFQNGCNNLYSQ